MRNILASSVAIAYLLALPVEQAGAQALSGTPTFSVHTVAGTTWTGDDGPPYEAMFRQPTGVAVGPAGQVYVSEVDGNRVRRIATNGLIETIAGTGVRGRSGDDGPAKAARLNAPYGLAVDARETLYIADLGNGVVRGVTPEGVITTVAGGGEVVPSVDNGGKSAIEYALSAPRNVAIDPSDGSLYISDFGAHRIYRVTPDGLLTVVAGTGTSGFSGDGGAAIDAQLSYPAGIVMGAAGALFVSDSQNGVVRQIQNGVIHTIPQMAAATVFTPTGLALDALGEILVVDAANGRLIRLPRTGNPNLMASSASDLALGMDGRFYVTDGRDGMVRRVAPSGETIILAGGGNPARGDMGPANQALLNRPSGLAADAVGNLYIADRSNHKIRKVTPDGGIDTIAGTGQPGNLGDGAEAALATLSQPSSVAVSTTGEVYVSDTGNHRIRRITPDGIILPVTGVGAPGFGGDDGPALEAALNTPGGIAVDLLGNVFVADSANGRIRKIDTSGTITTVLKDLKNPQGLALDSFGTLYFTEETGKRVQRLDFSTGDVVEISPGPWIAPRGVSVADSGALFVADMGRQQILTLDRRGRAVPVAGTGALGFSGDDGPALQAELAFPSGVASVPNGDILIADLDNDRVRRLARQPAPESDLSVWNAASRRPGPIVPNMLAELHNTGLSAADAPDTFVLFNSIPVPIFSMDDSRILVQAPAEIISAANVQVLVINQGSIIAQRSFDVAAAAPALFTGEDGQASATNADGSINSTSTPAARGSTVSILGTGLGLGDQPAIILVGGTLAEQVAVSQLSGFPGIFEANVRIPDHISPGSAAVTISVGGVSSPAGVFLMVR